MANTNTDLTEEDAADLQFPKANDDLSPVSNNIFLNSETTYCANCFVEVHSKFIMCEKCNMPICLGCFSNGVEFSDHKNDHDYRIFSTNFVLFEESDWTAEEEYKLLEGILNYGNWDTVAEEFPNRTVSEIIDHYDYFYIKRKGSDKLPDIINRNVPEYQELVVPYRFDLSDHDQPPRYLMNNIGYKSLAGYNPARSDFENDFDKSAEDILSNIDLLDDTDPHHNLLTNLQTSLIQIYNRRLVKRERWKNILRNHGLLLVNKTYSWLKRYDCTVHKSIYEKMIRFMQVCEPIKFDLLMEGLHRTGELRVQISRLSNLRKIGITTLAEARMYLKLNQIHESNKKSLKLFRSNPAFNFKHNKEANLGTMTKFKQKRSVPPIEVSGMPGYNKLSPKEVELCSTVRLVPVTYFQLKDTLMAECSKNGSISLQTARRLLKIDVNKTRKLFDFLLEEGYIKKSSV